MPLRHQPALHAHHDASDADTPSDDHEAHCCCVDEGCISPALLVPERPGEPWSAASIGLRQAAFAALSFSAPPTRHRLQFANGPPVTAEG